MDSDGKLPETIRVSSASSASEERNMVVVSEEEKESSFGEKDGDSSSGIVLGPLIPLKEQLDKDKEDESLRRWKQKLLGSIDGDLKDLCISEGQVEPKVTFQSLGIVSDGRNDDISLPIRENHTGVLFSLKEGSNYRLKLVFSVKHNIVSGLAYTNNVWKGRSEVDQTRGMLGTFAPQREPYVELLDEEVTPSGIMARGIYSALLKFVDDDKRCHLELRYSFEINKC